MENQSTSNVQAFIELVETSGAYTLDSGALMTGGNEIEAITGNPDNELVRFAWTDGDNELSAIFTEGGIAKGEFQSNGKFVCEDHEGNRTEFAFFEVQPILGPKSAEILRRQALALLEQANELDGLKPYAVVHEHAFGTSAYMCWSNSPEGPNQEDAESVLDSEFEEDKDEVLTIQKMDLSDLTGEDVYHKRSFNKAVQHAKTKGEWVVADPMEIKNTTGKILADTGHHIVQSLGKSAVIHEKKDLSRVPEKDEILSIAYDGKGHAMVEANAQDKGVSR
jgi:hypothetical protein